MLFLRRLFLTQDALTEQDYARSESLLTVEAACTMGMGALAGGPFLVAFALALGASNYQVGMLATVALLSQLMQIPGLALANVLRKRRAIVVILSALSRVLWVLIILIPVLSIGRSVRFLLQWFLISALVGAVVGPAWNSLLRDIVPVGKMGRLFARRLIIGTALGLALTMAGGYFIDWWKSHSEETVLHAYSLVFSIGAVLGVLGSIVLFGLPEPSMKGPRQVSVIDQLLAPVRDANFRKLLVFIACWSFAVNMAGPFFVIYMLDRIKVTFSTVTTLTVVSQIANLAFLNVWGRMVDRFSSKSVFLVAGPMFLGSVLAWSFTTMPERYFLTIPILLVIHVFSGIALAGVNITSSSMALKLSSDEKAHSYMTVFSLVAAVAGACGPFAGGVLADFFSDRELAMSLSWSDPVRKLSMYAINLKALDFVFISTFVIGLFAMHRLALVQEEGEVPQGKVVTELVDQVVLPLRMVSSVDGLFNRVSRHVFAVLRTSRASKQAELQTLPRG